VLNVHGVHDVGQMEPLVPEPRLFKVEIATGKLKRYKSLDTNQIHAELIEAGGETLCSETHRLIRSVWNKEELPQQWKEFVTVPIYKKGDKTVISIRNLPHINCQQNFIKHSSGLSVK
jgi:hypothetical protein